MSSELTLSGGIFNTRDKNEQLAILWLCCTTLTTLILALMDNYNFIYIMKCSHYTVGECCCFLFSVWRDLHNRIDSLWFFCYPFLLLYISMITVHFELLLHFMLIFCFLSHLVGFVVCTYIRFEQFLSRYSWNLYFFFIVQDTK